MKGLCNGFIDKDLYNSLHSAEKPDKLFNKLIKQYEDLLDIFKPSEKLQIFYVLLKIKISEETSYIVIKKDIHITWITSEQDRQASETLFRTVHLLFSINPSQHQKSIEINYSYIH